MNRSKDRITRSTAKRLQAFPKVYEEAFTGASIIVTPSATGKGVHMRWQYPESILNDQETIQTGHLSSTNQLAHELTLHIDDEFAHIFEGSLSSIDSDPSFQDLQDDAVDEVFASLFEGSLSSLSSSDEGLDDLVIMRAEEPQRTATMNTHHLPNRIILRPDDFSEAAKFRRMMKEEKRIEETFHAQWEKMLEQRQMALRTIKSWTKKCTVKHDTQKDESTGDNESADHQMEIDAEDHKTVSCSGPIMCSHNDAAPFKANTTSFGFDRGQQGRLPHRAAPCRQLGPCGTIIIENSYQIWERTSPPPIYPQRWVSRRLAGRESTENLENALN